MPSEEERYTNPPMSAVDAEKQREVKEKIAEFEKLLRSKSRGLTGPGKRLTEDTVPAVINHDECEGEVSGIERPHLSPIAVKVNRIVHQNSGLKSLVCEMLATFTLPANAEHLDKLGPRWNDIVASWTREFNKHAGE
jgi:hypothetical protein